MLAPEVVASFPASWVLNSSGLYTWSRECRPSSRLSAFVPRLRIWIASLTFLVRGLESLSMILVSSQSIRWFSWATWSVIADLCCSVVDDFLMALVNFFSAIFSESFWCSLSLTPNWRPVSPTYVLLQPYKELHRPLHLSPNCSFCLWDKPTKISMCWLVSSLWKPCISSKFSETSLQCLQHMGSPPSLCLGCHFVCWFSFSFVVYSPSAVVLYPWPTWDNYIQPALFWFFDLLLLYHSAQSQYYP